MALLELENVHTYYGIIHALKGVSLTVDEAEIVSLIGGNGAGKSTTLKTMKSSARVLSRYRKGVESSPRCLLRKTCRWVPSP